MKTRNKKLFNRYMRGACLDDFQENDYFDNPKIEKRKMKFKNKNYD